MKIIRPAKAGTMESSDIFIMIEPNDGCGIDIDLESIVIKQFGNLIRKTILDTLKKLEIIDAKVTARDRGALDYAIKSRVETAVKRASLEVEE